MNNPLIKAVQLQQQITDAQLDILYELGIPIKEEWDDLADKVSELITGLVIDTEIAVADLAPRSRRARMNLIWNDFQRHVETLKKEYLLRVSN